MNFTREPIIESIISSNEGYKLKLSKLQSSTEHDEDFCVYSLELISYGSSYFYRHREKPKSFLLPVAEYALVQIKDTRLSLKYATVDKSIKITPERQMKKPEPRSASNMASSATQKEGTKGKSENISGSRTNARSKPNTSPDTSKVSSQGSGQKTSGQKRGNEKDVQKPSGTILQPPTSLISDSLKKYKSIDFSDKQSFSLIPAPTTIVDIPTVDMPAGPQSTPAIEPKIEKIIAKNEAEKKISKTKQMQSTVDEKKPEGKTSDDKSEGGKVDKAKVTKDSDRK